MTARSTRAVAAVALIAAALLLGTAGPASAHATLVSSSPAQGARLDALPDQVRFEFTEEIAAPAYVIVTAPDGSSVVDGDPVVEGRAVSQALTAGPEGGYTMAYRAMSKDGHPVTGAIAFTVGTVGDAGPEASPGAPATAAPDEESPEAGEPAAAEAGEDSVSRRQVVAVAGGAGLFGAALLLLLLARRAGP